LSRRIAQANEVGRPDYSGRNIRGIAIPDDWLIEAKGIGPKEDLGEVEDAF